MQLCHDLVTAKIQQYECQNTATCTYVHRGGLDSLYMYIYDYVTMRRMTSLPVEGTLQIQNNLYIVI